MKMYHELAQWWPLISAPEEYAEGSLHEGNILACNDLLDAIEEDRLPEANVYEARQTVEMIASVFESHRRQQPVKLPLDRRDNPLLGLE